MKTAVMVGEMSCGVVWCGAESKNSMRGCFLIVRWLGWVEVHIFSGPF